jgi:hypothetical protein
MNNFFMVMLFTSSIFAQTEKDSTVNKLDEVIITGSKKVFTNEKGNLKIDVANSIYKSVPDVIDLLSKLPKIQVSADKESLSVVGKGAPLIYIDNIKAEISDLTSMAVDDIKTIEIIENPSAKYEAEGRAVLLITRKASRREGFQMILSEVASFKKKFNNYLGANTSLRKGKTEFRANFSYNRLDPWESNGNDYEVPAANIKSDYLVAGFTNRSQYVYGTSVLHQITEGDYFTASANGKFQDDDFNFSTQSFNNTNGVENNVITEGRNQAQKQSGNLAVGYNNKLADETNLFVGMRYSAFRTSSEIISYNNYNDTQFAPFRDTDQSFDVGLFSAKADFETKVGSNLKLESGITYSSADANTFLASTDFENNIATLSEYRMTERNSAAYSQLSQSIKKFTWSFGLRAEQAIIDGKYKNQAALVNKNYTNIFPKAEIVYRVDSARTIMINYGKSISRPDFSATSQSSTYINPYFVFTGNLDLNPSFSDELSANFQYKDKSVKASVYRIKDNINYSFVYDDAEQLLTLRNENFDNESGFGLELTLPFAFKLWNTTNICSVSVSKIEDAGAVQNEVKPYLYYYSNHTFKLAKQWTGSITGWGITKRYQGILENNAFFILDLAMSKAFKDWLFTVSANDVFSNMNFTEKFNLDNVSTFGKYYTDTHEFSIAVKYVFGKVKSVNIEEKQIDENADRIK